MDFNNIQIENYANQLAYKIINSRIINYPFPHAETSDMLPYDLLNEIEKNFPDKDELISITKTNNVKTSKNTKNKNPYDFRYNVHLTQKKDISRLGGTKLIFWEFFTNVMSSPLIFKSFFSLYNKHLQKRFGKDLKDKMFYPDLMLIHDKANYALGPHTDHPKKVIVILIYLSSDTTTNSMNLYGTSIYIPKETSFICDGTMHHNHKDFYKIYTSSFKKNNSLSFFKTNNSFHGVETVPDKPIERKLIQYSIFLK